MRLFTFASMDLLVKISDSQLEFLESTIETRQEGLIVEIEDLKQEINVLQHLLKSKEALFKDNGGMLVQLGGRKDELQKRSEKNHLPNTIGDYIDLPSGAGKIKEINVGQYKINSSSWEKVRYILNEQNKALTARQIIEDIYNHEPELRNVPNGMKDKNETNVFAVLSNYSKVDKIKRFKKEGKQYKYGLKKWFDEFGEIKKEYLI